MRCGCFWNLNKNISNRSCHLILSNKKESTYYYSISVEVIWTTHVRIVFRRWSHSFCYQWAPARVHYKNNGQHVCLKERKKNRLREPRPCALFTCIACVKNGWRICKFLYYLRWHEFYLRVEYLIFEELEK